MPSHVGQPVGNDSFFQTGLEPDQRFTVSLMVAEKKENPFVYENPFEVKTEALMFAAMQAKVVNEGNVIVESVSNIQDDTENVGVEWRRGDLVDDFPSNSATAYLYNGTMQAYIRNLNTSYLFKFRFFFESSSGNRYYSDWMGIDPTNTSYFEPTVHTYAACTDDETGQVSPAASVCLCPALCRDVTDSHAGGEHPSGVFSSCSIFLVTSCDDPGEKM